MAAEERCNYYGSDEDEDEDEVTCGRTSELDPSQFGENTPVAGSRRPSKSEVWKWIKRLKGAEHRRKRTHVCLICWTLLSLSRDTKSNGRFQTSRGKTHLDEHHPGTLKANEEAHEASSATKKGRALFPGSGGDATTAPSSSTGVETFRLSTKDIAMAKAALFYTYGGQRTSKRTFDDKWFRGMLQAYYEAGGGSGPAPFVTANGLKAYVVEEFKIFKHFLTLLLQRAIKAAQGNPPAQGLHDCATLANHIKCIAVGIEIVDPDDFTTWSIAVAMEPVESGSDISCAEKLEEVIQKMTGS